MSSGRGAAVEKAITCIPYFDRPVVRAGHDRFAIWGERYGSNVIAVGVLLLLLKLECACHARRRGVKGAESATQEPKKRSPASQTLIVPFSKLETIWEESSLNATDVLEV